MKSYRHLLNEMVSDTGMEEAFLSAIDGKRDRRGVRKVMANYGAVKEKVRECILSCTYPTPKHSVFTVTGGAEGKEREIVPPLFTPTCPEHWLHHILMRSLGPVLMHGAYFHSHAAIQGKGVHSAKKYIVRFLRRHPRDGKYFLKLDIRKFYRSIPVQKLREKIGKIVKEREVLSLVDWVLAQGENGLPLGFYTSQFFANFYLQELDSFITQTLRPGFYLRYMDDLLLFSANRRKLHTIGKEIETYLRGEGLSLKHPPQVRLFSDTPLNFIGFKFYPKHTGIRRAILLRTAKVARRMRKQVPLSVHDAGAIISYAGWFRVTDTYRAWRKYISPFVNAGLCKETVSASES